MADEIGELTLLWNVGPKNRNAAHGRGFYRWNDPRLSAADVDVKGAKPALTLDKILRVNGDNDSPAVLPARIETEAQGWRDATGLEFFVDFEFCSDLDDDFKQLRKKGGQPLIFIIGCGHIEEGEWRFKSFMVDNFTEDEESRIISEWMAHMRAVRERMGVDGKPRVFHWSQAEVAQLETDSNSAREMHGSGADWDDDMEWVDFLKIMRAEPIVARRSDGTWAEICCEGYARAWSYQDGLGQ